LTMERWILPDRPIYASLFAKGISASRFVAGLPFKLIGRVVARTVQVLFAIVVLILHPQVKWLAKVIAESALVRNYLKPGFTALAAKYYEPYFVYLRELPPYWATFSIAVPLAVLEPAKAFATVMIAERPKAGVLLWLFLQGVSFVLIDRTWAAVRPQSRKIWLVSRLHAWAWLNAAYGKHLIGTSSLFQTLARWKAQARREIRFVFLQMRRAAGKGR